MRICNRLALSCCKLVTWAPGQSRRLDIFMSINGLPAGGLNQSQDTMKWNKEKLYNLFFVPSNYFTTNVTSMAVSLRIARSESFIVMLFTVSIFPV